MPKSLGYSSATMLKTSFRCFNSLFRRSLKVWSISISACCSLSGFLSWLIILCTSMGDCRDGPGMYPGSPTTLGRVGFGVSSVSCSSSSRRRLARRLFLNLSLRRRLARYCQQNKRQTWCQFTGLILIETVMGSRKSEVFDLARVVTFFFNPVALP